MNIKQLRYVCEVAHNGLNVSRAAATLHASQPAVSMQIQLLEKELGLEIFSRKRNRLLEVTTDGSLVIERAQRALLEVDYIREMARSRSTENSGNLIIAASHTQARYVLPQILRKFAARFPDVRTSTRDGNETQICDILRSGDADLGIIGVGDARTASDFPDELAALPCQEHRRLILVPAKHRLLKLQKPSLADIAQYPLILYAAPYTSAHIVRAFEKRGLRPWIASRAANADVVKAYIENGLGISVLTEMVFDPKRDKAIRAIDASHLFGPSKTYILLHRKRFHGACVFNFIEMFAPRINRQDVQTALGN